LPNKIGGVDEVPGLESPELKNWQAWNPSAAATTGSSGDSVFDPRFYDDPMTRTHEMVHQAQMRTDWGRRQLPSSRELKAIGWDPQDYSRRGDAAIETPAYQLGSDAGLADTFRGPLGTSEGARDIARYSDLMRRRGANDRAVSSLQMAMPESVVRQMLMQYPPNVAWPKPPDALTNPDY
jgi:hypothetical protein